MRSDRFASGLAAGVISRATRFATTLWLTRAIVQRFGSDDWGMVALATATVDMVLVFDLAIHEVAVYETARQEERAQVLAGLNQTFLLALFASAVGTLVLGALALVGGRGLSTATVAHSHELKLMLLAAAVSYPLNIVGNLYSGTLQGLGWIRELNAVAIVGAVLDLGVVLLGLHLELGIVGIQVLRAALPLVRVVTLLVALARLKLPIGRPAAPDWPRLWQLLRYSVGYNLTRGLGKVVYSSAVPLGQLFASARALGAFSAADQWASTLYKLSHVLWESLFHRLVRNFRPAATAEERERGRFQFEGSTTALALGLTPAAAALVLAGPSLFRVWLGSESAAPSDLLPYLALAWLLNATGSPSSAALMAVDRFSVSIPLHVVAVVAQVALSLLLGSRFGILGLALATAIANVLLYLLLSAAACQLAGSRYPGLLAWTALPAAVASVSVWASRGASTIQLALVGGAIAAAAATLALVSPSLRRALVTWRRPPG